VIGGHAHPPRGGAHRSSAVIVATEHRRHHTVDLRCWWRWRWRWTKQAFLRKRRENVLNQTTGKDPVDATLPTPWPCAVRLQKFPKQKPVISTGYLTSKIQNLLNIVVWYLTDSVFCVVSVK
jgi:hypothetical protein